jgi:glycosyltransferase involved in cell wall biosynthesis
MLFSVVIPAYNSHAYIRKALDSLSSQAVLDFETIIVDDASPLESYSELQQVIRRYTYPIKLVRQQVNGGPGKARKEALKHADGEYIIFLDSDDHIESIAFSVLSEIIREKQADVVLFDCTRIYKNKSVKLHTTDLFNSNSTKSDFVALSYDSLWCMCVKKNLLETIELPELFNAEDAASVPIILLNANKISFSTSALYAYNYRPGSLSVVASSRLIDGFIGAWQYLNNNRSDLYGVAFEFRAIRLVLYGVIFNLVRIHSDKQRLNEVFKQFVSDNPTWSLNPYIHYLPFRKRLFLGLVKFQQWNLLKLYVGIQEFINRIYNK